MQRYCEKCGFCLPRYPTIECKKCRLYSQCKLHIKYTKVMDSEGITPAQKYCLKCFESNRCFSCGIETAADIYCDGCDTKKCIFCFGMFGEKEDFRNDGTFRKGSLCHECISIEKTKCGLCNILLFPSRDGGCGDCGELYCDNHLKLLEIGAEKYENHYNRICDLCFEKRGPKICSCDISSCIGYNCDECKSVVCSTIRGIVANKKTICGRCIVNNAVKCEECFIKVHPDLMKECGLCKQRKWCDSDMREIIIPADKGIIIRDVYCIHCYHASQPKQKEKFSCDTCGKSVGQETNIRGTIKFTCVNCFERKRIVKEKCLICDRSSQGPLDFMTSCDKCKRKSFCKSHIHFTRESISMGFIPTFKSVMWCETCFASKRHITTAAKEEYKAKRISKNRRKIDDWIFNNPEWEDEEREKYMKKAEDKWSKILAEKALEKLEDHDSERIKRKRRKEKRK